jgi:hypothetical protein
MSYTEADLTKLLQSNPELVIVTDGTAYTTLEPRTKPVQVARLSEHDLQVAIIAECDKRAKHNPAWGMCFAIPNGGHRHPAVAGKLKAEGVRAGVPDLFVPCQRHGYAGLFIELKAGTNKPTEAQRTWLCSLQEAGYYCKTIWDDPEAVIELIAWYLEAAS